MSAPNPVLYASGTVTPLTPFDFGTLAGSETSATESFDLANEGSGAEDVTEILIGVEESDDAGATWNTTGDISTNRWLQVRAVGVDGDGIEPQTTAWTPVGVGARLSLSPIPADTRRQLEARVVVPANCSSASKQIKLTVSWRVAYTALPGGIFESGLRGFCGGTGDLDATMKMAGGTFAETGTPDNNLNLTDTLAWKYQGVSHVAYPQALSIAASSAGKARWVLVLAGTAITTSTASAEVTAPAPLSDRPAAPDGEVVLAYIHRDDGAINTADIYYPDARTPQPFSYRVSSGLDIEIGGGDAVIDNRLIHRDYDQSVTLSDSTTNIVYALPDGSTERVDSGTDPSWPHAEPAWSLTTSGGAVTVARDLRRILGPELVVFEARYDGTPSSSDKRYWYMPEGRAGYIKLPNGIDLSVSDMGDRAAGSLIVDLQVSTAGGSWTSLFSSSTYKPTLAYNDADLVAKGFLPDTVAIPANSRLRANIAQLPTGGSAGPSNVVLRVPIEVSSL